MPKLSTGIAIGVCNYIRLMKVASADVGSTGNGTTIFPLLVPPQLLAANITQGFLAMRIMGVMAPLMIQGVSNGLATGFASLALIQMQHPQVGTGTGVAKFIAPSAIPLMIQGFSSVGMTTEGSIKTARAVGIGLDATFAVYVQPVPIVGSASPTATSGLGFGAVI